MNALSATAAIPRDSLRISSRRLRTLRWSGTRHSTKVQILAQLLVQSTRTDAATLSQAWIESVSTKVAILLTRLRTLGFLNKLPVNEVKILTHLLVQTYKY